VGGTSVPVGLSILPCGGDWQGRPQQALSFVLTIPLDPDMGARKAPWQKPVLNSAYSRTGSAASSGRWDAGLGLGWAPWCMGLLLSGSVPMAWLCPWLAQEECVSPGAGFQFPSWLSILIGHTYAWLEAPSSLPGGQQSPCGL
jgi:hypothetical protein